MLGKEDNFLGPFYRFSFFLGQLRVGGLLLVAGLASVVVADQGAHENYCKDLPDFTKLKFEKQDVRVCHTKIEKICRPVEVTKCVRTPTIDCNVSLNSTIII